MKTIKYSLVALATVAALGLGHVGHAEDKKADAPASPAGDLVALPLELPKPAYKETPKNVDVPRLEKLPQGQRAPYMAPKGCVNLALKKTVTSSEKDPIVGSLDLVTDGQKEATEGSYVELGRGNQWVQVDLGASATIHAIALWHYHGQARVYHDVVIQVSDDKDFITGVKTLFNNDHENELGLGAGEDMNYWDTYQGKIVAGKGTAARYVRCYSNGNTSDEQNQYTELEVWGLAK